MKIFLFILCNKLFWNNDYMWKKSVHTFWFFKAYLLWFLLPSLFIFSLYLYKTPNLKNIFRIYLLFSFKFTIAFDQKHCLSFLDNYELLCLITKNFSLGNRVFFYLLWSNVPFMILNNNFTNCIIVELIFLLSWLENLQRNNVVEDIFF